MVGMCGDWVSATDAKDILPGCHVVSRTRPTIIETLYDAVKMHCRVLSLGNGLLVHFLDIRQGLINGEKEQYEREIHTPPRKNMPSRAAAPDIT